ncbi:MAG: hypothetical protein QE271_00340 [Bacteriovoracaceae bacterium]|nr:hypothetical protein [Bacteriovoracaceae bacterium]
MIKKFLRWINHWFIHWSIVGSMICFSLFTVQSQTQSQTTNTNDPNYKNQMRKDGFNKWMDTGLELAKNYFQGMTHTGQLEAPYSGMFPTCRVPAKVIGYGKFDAKGCSGIDQGSYMNVISMATKTKEFYDTMINPDSQISNGAGTCSTTGVSCINCMSTGYNNQLQKRQNQLTKALQEKLDAITKERAAFDKKIRDEFQPTYNLLFKLDDAAMNGMLDYLNFNNSECTAYNDNDGIRDMLMGSGQSKGLKDLNDAMLKPESTTQKAVKFLNTDVAGQLNYSIITAMNNIPTFNSFLSGKMNVPLGTQANADVAKKVGDVAEEVRTALSAEHKQLKEQLEVYLDPANADDGALLENIASRPGVNLQNAMTAWENNSITNCIYGDHKVNGVTDSVSFTNEIVRRVKVTMNKKRGESKGRAVIGDSETENLQNLIKEYLSPDSPNTANWKKRIDRFEAELKKNKTTSGKMLLDTNGISTKIVSGGAVGVAAYLRSFAHSCASRGKKDGRSLYAVREKVQEIGSKIKVLQEQYKRRMFEDINKKLVNCVNNPIPTTYGSSKECTADSLSVGGANFCYANSLKCAQNLNKCRMRIGQYYTAKKTELNTQRDEINKYVRNRISDINAKNNKDIKDETTVLEQLGFPLAFFPDIKKMGTAVDFGPTKEMDSKTTYPNVDPAVLNLDNIEDNIKKTTAAMIDQYDNLKKEIEEGTKKVAAAVEEVSEKSKGKIDEYIAACGEAFNAFEKGIAEKKAAEQKARDEARKERAKYRRFCSSVNAINESLIKKTLPCTTLVDDLTKNVGEASLGQYKTFQSTALDACAARKLQQECKQPVYASAAPGSNNIIGYNCDQANNEASKYFETNGELKQSVIEQLQASLPPAQRVGEVNSSNDCTDKLYRDNKDGGFGEKDDSSGSISSTQ